MCVTMKCKNREGASTKNTLLLTGQLPRSQPEAINLVRGPRKCKSYHIGQSGTDLHNIVLFDNHVKHQTEISMFAVSA